MKILFDLSSAQPQGNMKINGGGEYALILFMKLLETKNPDTIIDILLNSKLGENSRVNSICSRENINAVTYACTHEIEDIVINRDYTEIVFPICYPKYSELNIDSNIRVITIIHDLCEVYYSRINVKYGRFPKLDRLNWLRFIKNKIVQRNDFSRNINLHNKVIRINNNQELVTVTYYSKSTLQFYLNIPSNMKINVFYSPERYFEKISPSSYDCFYTKYGLEKNKYFMLNAGCRWAKNNAIVLFVLDRMFSNKKYKDILESFKVIIIGTDNLYKDYFEKKIINKNRFIIENYVDDNTIQSLYINAHLFMFPSVIEGFGAPPVEAMKYNTISACSTSMSIPEVCGDAVIYFDPYDEKSIEQAILRSFDKSYMKIKRKNTIRRFNEIQVKRQEDLNKLLELILHINS